jgi:hypothetical protein
MSNVLSIMIARFMTLYGEPKTDDLNSFMAEYDTAMSGMSPDVLKAATDMLVRRTMWRTWPTVGSCVATCTEAANRINPLRAPETSYAKSGANRAPPDAHELERTRAAKEWRDLVAAEYGSVEMALEAHQRRRNAVPMASRTSTFRRISLTKRSLDMSGDK